MDILKYGKLSIRTGGGVKRGKEETYTWVVAKTRRDGIYYVIKYSDIVCWINKVGCSYDELRRFITGQQSERDFLV